MVTCGRGRTLLHSVPEPRPSDVGDPGGLEVVRPHPALGERVATSALVDLVSAVLLIAAAVLAVLVVRDVTARQDHKNTLITAGQFPSPPAAEGTGVGRA